MASRILVRRFPALTRASSEVSSSCRDFASAAQKIQDVGNVGIKQKSAPSASTAYRMPLNDLFPPLARGAPLVNMLDMVDEIFGGQAPKMASGPYHSSNRTSWDATEDEKTFKLRLDMPGLSKEEVNVDVEDGNLTIKGQKKEDAEDDWSSRSTGTYNIKIKLPDNVKIDAIKAEMKHGVLRITAPKVDETKRRVAVSVD